MNTILPQRSSTADRTVFGFWVYLMSDCLLFASLFAVYAVIHNNTYGGLPARDLFSLPFVLFETVLLLTSSFTCGLATLCAAAGRKGQTLVWLGVTFALGAAFLFLEINDFAGLVHSGNSWQRSGFLSAFFGLVGTHGLHVALGLLWLGVLAAYIALRGLSPTSLRRLTCFSLFWHFLDLIWICIFTIVYVFGAL